MKYDISKTMPKNEFWKTYRQADTTFLIILVNLFSS